MAKDILFSHPFKDTFYLIQWEIKIHLFIQKAYIDCEPHSVVGPGDTAVHTHTHTPCPYGAYNLIWK